MNPIEGGDIYLVNGNMIPATDKISPTQQKSTNKIKEEK